MFFLLLLSVSGCTTILGPPDSGEGGPPSDVPFETFPLANMVDGQPAEAVIDMSGGLFIWRNGNKWSVRAKKYFPTLKTLPRPREISGIISIRDGRVRDVRSVRTNPFSRVTASLDSVSFRFELDQMKEAEGFDFSVDPRTFRFCVLIDAGIDGNQAPGLVRLGRNAHVPDSIPVNICFTN